MRTLIRGIGQILSGDLDSPALDADSILVQDGHIHEIGHGLNADAELVIDASGTTVAPGLIDSHSHPVIGDFTPRQRTLDFYESMLHGGVTSAISAGEPHLPGRPTDVDGIKALAILASKSFANVRPGGVKVRAGAPILEIGLEERDFADMAAAGVGLIGEIGLGSVKTADQAAPMVAWARQYGMISTIHTGGPSIPGSSAIGADMVLETKPDIVGHINGGTTSMPRHDIERLVDSGMALEIVHNGNGKTALETLELARSADVLDSVMLGTDSPSGSGVMPLGMLRLVAHLSSLGGLAPEQGWCLATGTTNQLHRGGSGTIEIGQLADLVIMDAPIGSVGATAVDALQNGDLPGISMVLVDGEVKVGRSRNTPPAARVASIEPG
jgi:enamidase